MCVCAGARVRTCRDTFVCVCVCVCVVCVLCVCVLTSPRFILGAKYFWFCCLLPRFFSARSGDLVIGASSAFCRSTSSDDASRDLVFLAATIMDEVAGLMPGPARVSPAQIGAQELLRK